MYEITGDAGKRLTITEHPTYCKMQSNGTYGLASEGDAQGIVVDGKVFQIPLRQPLEGVTETALAREIDAGALLSALDAASENADELLVDQEYRLTMIELGV